MAVVNTVTKHFGDNKQLKALTLRNSQLPHKLITETEPLTKFNIMKTSVKDSLLKILIGEQFSEKKMDRTKLISCSAKVAEMLRKLSRAMRESMNSYGPMFTLSKPKSQGNVTIYTNFGYTLQLKI
ncbi:hypothetical protein Tco_0099315 [Tanacetum coccineum]